MFLRNRTLPLTFKSHILKTVQLYVSPNKNRKNLFAFKLSTPICGIIFEKRNFPELYVPMIVFGEQKQKTGENLTVWGYLEGSMFVIISAGQLFSSH